MREIAKGSVSVFIHFVIGFICCLIYVFFFEKLSVLPPFLFKLKLTETCLLFIQAMPGLLVSSILIGYALIFRACNQNTVPRYSDILLQYFKEALIVLFFFITTYILLVEIASPALFRYRYHSEIKTHDYYDFVKGADKLIRNSRAGKAYDKVKSALGIWKDGEEALKLLDRVKVLREVQEPNRRKGAESLVDDNEAFLENLTAEGVLSISKRYLDSSDFYTAHFYAMRAYDLSPANGLFREEALRIAAHAWNQIEKGSVELMIDFDLRLYQAKKAGYEMMLQQNYIKAYYQFIDIQRMIEQNNALKRDPDIDRFVEITKQKLLEEVFFIEETESLASHESVRYVDFTVPSPEDGSKTEIKIEGLSFVVNNGIQEIYGRNCEITHYSGRDVIRYKCRVPFVKFISVLNSDGRSMIRMQLQAVDSQHDAVIFQPLILEGAMPREQMAVMLLALSDEDFEHIIAACEGEKTMTLPQLYAFQKISVKYGFPVQIYHREILARISDIFLILIISVCMLILAWSFRVPPHHQFKATWLLAFPIFFAAATGFVEVVRYCTRLLITLLSDALYHFSSIFLLLVFILLFIGVSFLFFAQRSDA